MAGVNGVNSVIRSDSEGGIRQMEETRQVSNELGKDAFLQILVAQLSNQDPLAPTSDTEFIAQMAQFSSLEQMQNMSQTMERQAIHSYLGKEVTSNYAVDGEGQPYRQDVYGRVTGVTNLGGTSYLVVADYNTGQEITISPEKILTAYENSNVEDMTELQTLYSHIGKDVIATHALNGDGEIIQMNVNGRVTDVVKMGGEHFLIVQNYAKNESYTIPAGSVTQVAGSLDMQSMMSSILDKLNSFDNTKRDAMLESIMNMLSGADGEDGPTEALDLSV